MKERQTDNWGMVLLDSLVEIQEEQRETLL